MDPARPSNATRLSIFDVSALESLRPMALVGAVVFAVFIGYNAIDLPAGVREPTLVYDGLLCLWFTGLWLIVGRLPPRWIHPIGFVSLMLVFGNILFVQGMLGAPVYAIYVDIVLIAAGMVILRRGWMAATLVGVWVGWLAVAIPTSPDPDALMRFSFSLFASSLLSLGVHVGRLRRETELARYVKIDRERKRELVATLAHLDEKVAERTHELTDANEALRQQIAERERAEEAAADLAERLRHAQRLEAVGQLAGGIAHDFNNLLTVIDGNLEVAMTEAGRDANTVVEVLREARFATSRATDVTRQLLAFSRKQVLEPRTLDLYDTVEKMRRILSRLVGGDVQVELTRDAPGLWIEADPTQVELVVLNLVVNARDAMPRGGRLTLQVCNGERDGHRYARLRVSDEGVGMDATTRDRMFEPFFTTKPLGQGTGLGLSTVYGVVQQHHGFVEVTSSPGVGSTFEVWFPAADPPLVDPASLPPIPLAAGSEAVLIVEDDAAVRRLAERLLTRLGYDVITASSGEEAMSLAGVPDRRIDLLWTDVLMPGMSGVELAESARRIRPGLKILFASGYTGNDFVDRVGALPTDSVFLHKPYSVSDVATAVRSILDS